MSARILVVDDVPANVKLLEARLSAEYFDVLTASNGAEALAICARAECDIILLDVMMPDMDGFEVCRRLKTNPATHFIPVVMVTALDSPADRVRGLEAGADDFLTKPVSDVVLIARVRSLTRLKMMTDELRMRAITSLEIGMQAPERSAIADTGKGGRILLVDDRPSSYERLAPILASRAHGRRRDQSGGSAVPRRRGQLRSADRLAQPRQFRRPEAVQPGALAGAHPPGADPRDLPTPTTTPGCCAGWRSASTIICCARSTRTNFWRARAPRSAGGATPIICATTCRTRSRWRSRTR